MITAWPRPSRREALCLATWPTASVECSATA
ncbi:hypothetical protein L917_18768 [Phytophthora nicotianae]|uniref:Uncharacterized protein n=1 Tax=Phytophthora nicotianae TaxID=4792 RepID=W2I225_PHYNI|nr:hypothetical protein L916_18949 [Phytophthora nicotianae]ETL80767.1 hypothetical protein L917_18768 [Phytophthora nicotianae]